MSKILKLYRKYEILSIKQLSEKTGLSRPYISEYELSKRKVTLYVLEMVCPILGLKLSEFFKVLEDSMEYGEIEQTVKKFWIQKQIEE